MLKFRGLNGLRKTRSTVSDDLALIRRDDAVQAAGSAEIRVSNGANRATGAAERGLDLPRRPVVASVDQR